MPAKQELQAKLISKWNGGDDETRTRDLCRDSLGINVLSATYVLNGGCQVAEKDCRNRSPWVNLWVRIFAFDVKQNSLRPRHFIS